MPRAPRICTRAHALTLTPPSTPAFPPLSLLRLPSPDESEDSLDKEGAQCNAYGGVFGQTNQPVLSKSQLKRRRRKVRVRMGCCVLHFTCGVGSGVADMCLGVSMLAHGG